jgi:CheY-like chemotaxis protein
MDKEKLILLVEDNDHDTELVFMAIDQMNLNVRIDRVHDGVEALEYLQSRASMDKSPELLPMLVLLDIKLPRLDGIEVLSRMKTDEKFKIIPVVMLTSSREERDVGTCYKSGANAYVVKPVEFSELMEALRSTGHFWCAVNEMPL